MSQKRYGNYCLNQWEPCNASNEKKMGLFIFIKYLKIKVVSSESEKLVSLCLKSLLLVCFWQWLQFGLPPARCRCPQHDTALNHSLNTCVLFLCERSNSSQSSFFLLWNFPVMATIFSGFLSGFAFYECGWLLFYSFEPCLVCMCWWLSLLFPAPVFVWSSAVESTNRPGSCPVCASQCQGTG